MCAHMVEIVPEQKNENYGTLCNDAAKPQNSTTADTINAKPTGVNMQYGGHGMGVGRFGDTRPPINKIVM